MKMKKIVCLIALTLTLMFSSITVSASGPLDPQVGHTAVKILQDDNWMTAYRKDSDTITFNTRYMHLEGKREKPKIDAWVCFFQGNYLYLMKRVRFYYSDEKIQSKDLMIVSFNPDYTFDSCYQTGIYASKSTIKEGTVEFLLQQKIYDWCNYAGYLKILK